MSDLQNYVNKRLASDSEFADGFESGYHQFKSNMKEFKINTCDAFDLGSSLIYYAEGYSKFFKVWSELKKEFKDKEFNLKVTDYNLNLIQVITDYSYKWINISCSEQYIREHLLSLLVDDVDEYLANRE